MNIAPSAKPSVPVAREPVAGVSGMATAPTPAPPPLPAAPAFSPVAVLLAALEQGAPLPQPLPRPDSPPAREAQALLSRRLAALAQDAGLPGPRAPRVEVDHAGRVRVEPADPRAGALQPVLERHADVQALARLVHAMAGNEAALAPSVAVAVPPAGTVLPGSAAAALQAERARPAAWPAWHARLALRRARAPAWRWLALAVLLAWWLLR